MRRGEIPSPRIVLSYELFVRLYANNRSAWSKIMGQCETYNLVTLRRLTTYERTVWKAEIHQVQMPHGYLGSTQEALRQPRRPPLATKSPQKLMGMSQIRRLAVEGGEYQTPKTDPSMAAWRTLGTLSEPGQSLAIASIERRTNVHFQPNRQGRANSIVIPEAAIFWPR